MNFWVGVTDNSWFDFLSKRLPDEVNFWQPGGTFSFRALEVGEPFLFKLHYPINKITGGGFFIRHSILPISVAWEAFEQKNGAEDFESFRSRIMYFRRQHGRPEIDPMIGCIVLVDPFFLKNDAWIPSPKDWSPSIVQGKRYDTDEPIGAELWMKVQERLIKDKMTDGKSIYDNLEISEEIPRYGTEYLTRARLGQGAFRVLVTEIYNRRCAITGERTLPVLEAAHIKPYSNSGPHKINNGLLLRSDLHKLFDLGYLTITNDFHVEVSKRIKKEYKNGKEYYSFHGNELDIPSNSKYQPLREYIEWHNQHIFIS